MKNIIWFCRTSDSSSLSRITDSLLPLLSSVYNITLLSNKSNLNCVKNVITGSDCNSISYQEFIESQNKKDLDNIRFLNMKYILVQLVDLVYEGNYEYLLICNGVYEIDWITKILTSNPKYLTNQYGKKTKLVVWAPIDYIPSIKVIQNVIKADIFLTMTPVMMDEINKITNNAVCKIDWVGHGSDIINDQPVELTREKLISELNRLGTKICSKTPIKSSDIIILNANNYGPLTPNLDSVQNTPGTRKRLDITVKAFLKVLETNKNVKLWIHTNLKSFFEMLAIENLSISTFIDNLIFSNNTVTNEELSIIYQISNISIQTSTGEGWSLTNLEASMYRSLQVVPDFLACGYHFKDRGILIPVTRKTIKNEGGIDVIIGEVSVEDTAMKIFEAIDLITNNFKMGILDAMLSDAHNYAKNYTWSSVADKIKEILD